MRYISTRGQAAPQAFCDILLGGLAPDGGLYLPETVPQVSRAELDAWRKLSYADLARAQTDLANWPRGDSRRAAGERALNMANASPDAVIAFFNGIVYFTFG